MKFNVACLQLTCGSDVDQNTQSILNFSNQAIQAKADFIVTPENSSIFSSDSKELLSKSEEYENNSFIKTSKFFAKKRKSGS